MFGIITAIGGIGAVVGIILLVIWLVRKKAVWMPIIVVLASLSVMFCFQWAIAEQKIPKETDDYHLSGEMLGMSINMPSVVDVDIEILNKFFGSLGTTSYRVRGMVTKYEEDTLWSGTPYHTCYLESGDRRIHISFGGNEQTSDGEYIEIVGELGIIDKMYYSEDTTLSLQNAQIVERGSTVREQIENAKGE